MRVVITNITHEVKRPANEKVFSRFEDFPLDINDVAFLEFRNPHVLCQHHASAPLVFLVEGYVANLPATVCDIDLLKASEAEATRIIEGHRDRLLALVRELEEREVLEFDAIEACLSPGKRKAGAREKA